ncbi:MAG: type II toxin-antitoxin system YoeB family toxin [Thiomicrospira sp.]
MSLKGVFTGWLRIDESNRLVYAVDEDSVTIIACRYH